MVSEMKRHHHVIIAVVLGLFFWVVWSSLRAGRGPAALNQSPFLGDVIEPITIVEAMSFDDGGSKGLRISDARGKVKDICLEDTRMWEADPRILEGHHNIILNSFFPDGKHAQRVPISGVEERALLGLLERWVHQEPDAEELERRLRIYKRGEMSIDAFWSGLPDRSREKGIAISILRTLRARN